MKRTQIYLPENMHKELLRRARAERTSVSELIRKSVEKSVKKNMKPKKNFFKMLDELRFKGKGPKDLSEKIDYYLYEEPYK